MTKFKDLYTIVSQQEIAKGIFDLVVDSEEIAREAKAGQFVNVFVNDASKLLPRPISICEILDKKYIRLVYRVQSCNSGTNIISKLANKEKIALFGPLGNGFPLADFCLPPKSILSKNKMLLIGGGIGIPPMLEVAKQLQHRCDVSVVLGYRDSETFLLKDFEKVSKIFIATDDGSLGFHGTTIDFLREYEELPNVIMACGPTPMLKGLQEFCKEKNIECYLSLEERMACGIGACLACMVNTKEVNPNNNMLNKRICKEGPVFLSSEIVL